MKEAGEKEKLATVTKVHAKACSAVIDDERTEVRCVMSGKLFEKLKRETKPVAVGDRVRLFTDGKNWSVIEVLPRHNCLHRPSIERERDVQVIAANVDRMLVVASVHHPDLKPGLIDRFLVASGVEEMQGVVCINKIDLAATDESRAFIEEIQSIYGSADYPIFLTSAKDGTGVNAVKAMLADGITLIVGHSGVGKSTLLNAIDPRLRLATGDVSRKAKKGRHTTTSVRLLRLASGGFVIDTPGMREFGIASIEGHHLGHYFPEISRHLPSCRFPTCTHDHEPDCAVRKMVEAGEIPKMRYESYLRILQSL